MVALSKKLEKRWNKKERKLKGYEESKAEISGDMETKEKNIVPSTSSSANDNMQTSDVFDYNSLQS